MEVGCQFSFFCVISCSFSIRSVKRSPCLCPCIIVSVSLYLSVWLSVYVCMYACALVCVCACACVRPSLCVWLFLRFCSIFGIVGEVL